MDLQNPRYLNQDRTHLTAIRSDGSIITIPTTLDNSIYKSLVETGVQIAAYETPVEPKARLPKLLVVERLIAAVKFELAMAALEIGRAHV